MGSKLDDLLSKKKTAVPVLDLSKTIVQSKEEFKRLWEKVPDFKMRPVKVRTDEIKFKEKDFSFRPPRKETKKLLRQNGVRDPFYVYADPIPNEMRGLVLMDLCTVPIDWKMLTTLRPKTKLEEDYFSRLVEMGKLQLKTEARDKREAILNPSIKKVKNKSGIIETRLITCSECGEELCNGKTCMEFNYDLFSRIEIKPPKPKPPAPSTSVKGKSGMKKGGSPGMKRRIRKKSPSKKPAAAKDV